MRRINANVADNTFICYGSKGSNVFTQLKAIDKQKSSKTKILMLQAMGVVEKNQESSVENIVIEEFTLIIGEAKKPAIGVKIEFSKI
jgi:hypothetical protein